MVKNLYLLAFLIFLSPLFAGQKIIEKGLMELTNDKTGEVTYKILWRVPEGQDSYWLDAVPTDSPDAFSGEMQFTIPGIDPLSAISLGDFTATEDGMKRAIRAVEDVVRAANKPKGGNSSGSGSSSGSGAC